MLGKAGVCRDCEGLHQQGHVQWPSSGAVGLAAVLRLWPSEDPDQLDHNHPDLPPGHPHLAEHATGHAFVIDALHRRWPKRI